MLALVEQDDSAEVPLRQLDRLVQDRHHVGVDAVRLRLEGDAEHAVAEVPRLRAVVLEERRAVAAELLERDVARVHLLRDVLALREVVFGAVRAVERGRPALLHLVDRRGERDALRRHLLHGLDEAERVPRLERPHLPVVAPLHRVIDRGHAVRDLADAARRVGERSVEHLARERAGLALIRDERADAGLRVLDLLDLLRRLLHALVAALRAVRERLRIERLDRSVLLALVESALRLVAEDLLLDHRADVGRHLEDAALLVRGERLVAVVRDVNERVEADDVRRAEARALRVRHRHAGDRVDVLGRVPELDHQVDRRHHRVRADAVADEVRSVLRDDDALAEHVLAEAPHARHRRRIRVLAGHELEELHVTDGVEEVHHDEALLEALRAARHHLRDLQAGGVRRDDRLVADLRLELLEEALLVGHALDDRLDHEIAVLHLVEIVLDVADLDEPRERRVEQRCRARLQGLLEAARGEAVARRSALRLGFGEVRGDDVEEHDRDAGVGEVRGDAAAHDACADDAGSANRLVHAWILSQGWGDAAPEWRGGLARANEFLARRGNRRNSRV